MNDFSGGYGGGGEVATASPNGANIAYMQSNNSGSSIATNGTVQGSYVKSTGIVAGANVQASNSVGAESYFGTYSGSWWADSAGNSAQSGQAAASEFYTSGDVRFQQTGYSAGGSCNGVAVVNGYANGNAGQLLYCQNGQWQAMGGGYTYEGSWTIPYGTATSENIGNYDICAMTQYGTSGNDNAGVYPSSGPYANGTYSWVFYAQGADTITASCWDIG